MPKATVHKCQAKHMIDVGMGKHNLFQRQLVAAECGLKILLLSQIRKTRINEKRRAIAMRYQIGVLLKGIHLKSMDVKSRLHGTK